jgi:hypothetical protein
VLLMGAARMSNADRCRRYRVREHDRDMVRDMVRDMLPEVIQQVTLEFSTCLRHGVETEVLKIKEDLENLRKDFEKSHAEVADSRAGAFGLNLPSEDLLHESKKEKKETDSFVLTNADDIKPAVRHRVYAKHFTRFWEAYPHRGGRTDPKKPAADKFAIKVRAGINPEDIIAAAERYAEHVAEHKLELQYVPQAVKWLNQEYFNGFSELRTSEYAEEQMRYPNQSLPKDYEEVRRRLNGEC